MCSMLPLLGEDDGVEAAEGEVEYELPEELPAVLGDWRYGVAEDAAGIVMDDDMAAVGGYRRAAGLGWALVVA